MHKQLVAELKLLAGKVDEVIASSTFPDAVQPEYLGKAMRFYPAAGGKRLRPAIMLWSAAAAGGDVEKILPAALRMPKKRASKMTMNNKRRNTPPIRFLLFIPLRNNSKCKLSL